MAYTQDKLINAMASGQHFNIWKSTVNVEGAGLYASLWKATGDPIASTATPGLAGAVPDRTTVGALRIANAGSGVLFGMGGWVAGSIPGSLYVYDRLWHNESMSGIVTSDTSLVATTDVPSGRSSWADNEMWTEVTTPMGATGATLTVLYTNAGGTTGQAATQVHPVTGGAGAPTANQMFPMTLAGSDVGVKRPTSYSWSISTGTAGAFGVVVMKRLFMVPIVGNGTMQPLDWADLGLPTIPTDACLAMMFQSNTTTTGTITGEFLFGEMVA